MAIASYVGSEIVANTDTFDVWLTRTNTIIGDMGSTVVSSGNNNPFNVEIDGNFTVTNTVFTSILSGGVDGVPATINITTDAQFDEDVTISGGTLLTINPTTTNVNSPININSTFSINSTLPQVLFQDTNANDFGRITVNDGSFVIDSDYNNTATSSLIQFKIDGSEVGRFDQTGRFSLLDANTSSGTHVGIGAIGDDLNFWAGNTNYMTIDDIGNVGIGTTAPTVKLDINSTDAVALPSGTTAQRPTGVGGYIRYNTELETFEGFAEGVWGEISGGTIVASGNTAPVDPDPGDLWFSTEEPVGLYFYYDDGDSQQWVMTNGGAGSYPVDIFEANTVISSNFGDGTITVPSTSLTKGAAKATGYYAQSTPLGFNLYNTTSITDNSTGNYTANFTSIFIDNVYRPFISVADNSTGILGSIITLTTSTVQYSTRVPNTTALIDNISVYSVLGDLA